jgi:hypothetical protein
MLWHVLPMPNQTAADNAHPIIRIFSAPLPPGGTDPVPAMRREMSLLRIELEQLRARENEARKTNEFLVAQLDRVMDNRDQWQQEAERLSTLCLEYERTLNPPHWSLFWRRNGAAA